MEWNQERQLLDKAFLKMSNEESDSFLDELFSTLFNIERKSLLRNYDDWIILIDKYIRKNIREKINNKDLAEKIFLSESRFYHFFKEQTQVNVSRYVPWLRLKTIFQFYT